MNRKLCRNRKAVSTVIGTILMIMIVMVGMSVLFGALVVYSDNFQSGRGSAVLEAITVEDDFISSNKVQLSLFNTGKVELMINSVYIDGQIAPTISPSNLIIWTGGGEDGHKVLIVTAPTGINLQGSHSLKIVTERGSSFEGIYVW
jgi:uncharacterized protein YpmB